MYGYIYRTHNLVNGKMYIGQRRSSKFLNENYLGSGKIINRAIRKYGRENFKVELLDECFSEEELNSREKYWIDFYDATSSLNYYNLLEGGHGGFKYINDNKLSPSCSCKENHPMYGKIGKSNPLYGRKHSEETRKKLSERQLGKRSVTNGLVTIRIDSESDLPDGFWYGESKTESRTWTNERKKNFSNRISGTSVINNGMVTRRVKNEDLDRYLTEGYQLGYRSDQIKHGEKVSTYGMKRSKEFKDMISDNTKNRVWINNGLRCLRVVKDELDSYINSGWVRGRKIVERATTIESIG